MQALNYFLVSVVSYLGIVAGYVLMLAAPEEKKPGMKYFNIICYSLFLLSVFFTIFFRPTPIFIFLALFFAVVIYYSKKYQIYLTYLFFSIIFYLFSDSYMLFSVFSIIIFTYGLSAGSISIDLKHKKKSLLKIFSLIYFIIIANILRLIL